MVMPIREPTPQQPPKQPPSRTDKSISLSYAKEFVIAGFIPFDKALFFAEVFAQYMSDDFSKAQNSFASLIRATTTGKGA